MIVSTMNNPGAFENGIINVKSFSGSGQLDALTLGTNRDPER
jgi:hypothetical protein